MFGAAGWRRSRGSGYLDRGLKSKGQPRSVQPWLRSSGWRQRMRSSGCAQVDVRKRMAPVDALQRMRTSGCAQADGSSGCAQADGSSGWRQRMRASGCAQADGFSGCAPADVRKRMAPADGICQKTALISAMIVCRLSRRPRVGLKCHRATTLANEPSSYRLRRPCPLFWPLGHPLAEHTLRAGAEKTGGG